MTNTEYLNEYARHIETDSNLHRAIVIYTGDPPLRDLPLERESIETASRSSEQIRTQIREMAGEPDADMSVYQPGEFESPVHEALMRQAHLLVIISVSTETRELSEAESVLETATDNLRLSWSKRFSTGFETEVLRNKQSYVFPLIEEIPQSAIKSGEA